MTPTLVKLDRNFNVLNEVVVRPVSNQQWTGAEVHVNKKGEIFVSVRENTGQPGIVAKYRSDPRTHEFTKLNEALVGNVPRQFSLTENEDYFIVANQNGKNIEIFDAETFEHIESMPTPSMNPTFVMPL